MGFSQGEWNKWYFGFHAALDFNTVPPSGLPNSVLNSMSSTVSISDSLGQLLFYSDGYTIYNRNHQMMSNGFLLFGLGGVFAFKEPGQDSIYYIFTVKAYGTPVITVGLYYSLINMNLNGGLGGVIPGYKNIPVTGADDAQGETFGVRHHNNKDVWIVARQFSSNQYTSYLISSSGISLSPVLSPSFLPNPGILGGIRIKLSQDGTKFCAIGADSPLNVVELGNFNSLTGELTPLFSFRPVNGAVPESPWYLEFSPNSKLLYVTGPNNLAGAIYQYDLAMTDSAHFMQSQIMVSTTTLLGSAALQIGPDGKIYQSFTGKDSLSVINNPNTRGIGCNYQSNAVSLYTGTFCHDGLPQFLQKYKAYMHSNGNCQQDAVEFLTDIWPPPDSIQWNFGDPSSGSANFSTVANPFHSYSSAGNYTVELYVRHNDNRTDTTWQTITILPAPQPALGPDQTICTPQTATFDAGACIGCTYQWDDLTTMIMNIGSGQTYTTGTPGLYRVNVTGPNGCTGRDTVHLSIGTPVAVSVTITTSSMTVCAGEQVTFTSNANNAGSPPGYQWKVNGINASNANNATFNYTPVNGDCITLEVTSNANCVTGSPATSNPVCMTVNQLHPVSLTISSTATHTCAGVPVTFTAFPTNPGNSPVYLWKVNGAIAGSNNQIFNYNPVNGDCVTCLLTSDINCPTGNPALSNSICMTVDQPLPVSITVTTPQTTVCAGTTVTFTANPTHGGSLPSYQWKVNGASIVGATNSTYTYTPLNGDVLTCQLTSSDNCVTGNPALSPPVTMTVTPNPAVAVSITPSANPFCPGSQVTFIATPNHGGLFPTYLWMVNGGIAGTNSSSFAFIPVNGDVVTCELTSSDNCITGNPATSAPVIMIASPILTVSVMIAASSNPFCAGSQVTFTATPDHGGLVPGYQWKVNASNVINATNASYAYNAVNGDVVTCELTSSESCVSGNPALSNAITMTVNTNLPAGVTISTLTNPFCPGTTVTITAAPTNGGFSPTYQWKVNASNVINANNASYAYNAVNGDVVTCEMNSNLNCVTGNPAMSNSILLSERAAPNVTFSSCFDTVTILGAQPFSLHGGLPLGGQYSGPGVNTGIFTPSVAGNGLKTITYGYSNVYTCLATKTKTILVLPNPSFSCGNNLTDIRDNKVYPTVQIGSQCWMASNLDFGFQIPDFTPQSDNCTPENYALQSSIVNRKSSIYQWDELMRYQTSPGSQGLCPPGWHIPSAAEWNVLLNFYPGAGQAGGYLKDSLLVNGFHSYQQGFLYLNNTWAFTSGPDAGAMYWTSTASGANRAIARGLNDYNPSVSMYPSSRGNAFAVRCLRD